MIPIIVLSCWQIIIVHLIIAIIIFIIVHQPWDNQPDILVIGSQKLAMIITVDPWLQVPNCTSPWPQLGSRSSLFGRWNDTEAFLGTLERSRWPWWWLEWRELTLIMAKLVVDVAGLWLVNGDWWGWWGWWCYITVDECTWWWANSGSWWLMIIYNG